ncbi:unnamed protein product, partial [Mesorhabditis spiculigera]
MTGRGRGRGIVKVRAPNLAAARRETAAPVVPKQETPKTRGRGRGGRGRGAERGAHRGNSNIIQTAGIFSDGLAELEKKNRPVERDLFVKAERPVRAKEKENGGEEVSKTSASESYDQYWTIDQKEEDAEYSELIGPGLLSDYKKGTLPPVVLPHHDEHQFLQMLPSKVKREFEISEANNEASEKDQGADRHEQLQHRHDVSQCHDDDETDTTFAFSQLASKTFKRMLDEGNKELILLQLPTILGTLVKDLPVKEEAVVKQEHEQAAEQPSSVSTEMASPEQTALPRGKLIGCLVIKKDGQTFMEVGAEKIDITATFSGTTGEAIVGIELKDPIPPRNSDDFFGYPSTIDAQATTNALYFFGNVDNHMTASVDWQNIRDTRSTAKHDEAEAHHASSGVGPLEDYRRKFKELGEQGRQTAESLKSALARVREKSHK